MTDSTPPTCESTSTKLDGEAIAGLLAAARTARGYFTAHAAVARLDGRTDRAEYLEHFAGIMEDALAKATKARADA